MYVNTEVSNRLVVSSRLDVPDRVLFKLAVTLHRCLTGCTPPYLSDCCLPVAGADTRQHLRSAKHQLLSIPRYRLNTYGRRAFSVAGPTVWTLSQISSRTRTSVQTVSDVCLKRTCSRDTSAFSALGFLTITALYKFTGTYLLREQITLVSGIT